MTSYKVVGGVFYLLNMVIICGAAIDYVLRSRNILFIKNSPWI